MIDTHAHICDKTLDAGEIIASMRADGLKKIICVGYDFKSSTDAVLLSSTNADIYSTVGIHPNYAHTATDKQLEALISMVKNSKKNQKIVAVGEIGLDYFHKFCDKDTQRQWFLRQLEAYSDLKLPFVFHLRDAYGDFSTLIAQEKAKIRSAAVMHCYSGSAECARQYLDLGFYISFGGAVTFKNWKGCDVVRAVPLDRILVETDSPWLSPEPFRGKTNAPKNVKFVIEKLAAVLGLSFEQVEKATTANAERLFFGKQC